MQATDFLVHINETLGQPALEAIENDIRHVKGVASAGHHPKKSHLIQVVYDPDETKMSDIVQIVRQSGLNAQAVGL